MKCPHCAQHDSRVLKTERPIDEDYSPQFPFGTLKRRRRECKTCKRTFFSFEVHEETFRKLLHLMEQERSAKAKAAIALIEAEDKKKLKPAPRRALRTKPAPKTKLAKSGG